MKKADGKVEARGIPELDLHGYTRDQAIRDLTSFLDFHSNSWVHVITGKGIHSPNGGVLRLAVENLLIQREMEFRKTSAGSFLINGSSGVVFYEPEQPKDTKVVLQPRDDEVLSETYVLVKLPQKAPTSQTQRNHGVAGDLCSAGGESLAATAAVPAEAYVIPEPMAVATAASATASLIEEEEEMDRAIAEEIRQLEMARRASLMDAQAQADAKRKTELELEKAMHFSKQYEEEEKLRIEKEIEEVMRLSKLEDEKRSAEMKTSEEEELLKIEQELNYALKMSIMEEQKRREEEEKRIEEEIRKVMEMSSRITNKSEEEEEMLKQVLQMSQQAAKQSTPSDNEFEQALRRSINETASATDEEERLIQEAIAMSLRYSQWG